MELNEEKGKVLRYFLKNTPVGEHNEVQKDLEKIIGSDAIHSEAYADYLTEHLAFHGTVISYSGQQLMLTTLGRNGCTFFDPKHSCTFDINPYDLSATNVNQVESGTSLSNLLQQKVDSYLGSHFSETAQGRVFQNDEGLFVVISCASVNLRNMWTGEWLGDWKFSDGQLSGKISFNAHYFEEGNLQFCQNREVAVGISADSEEKGVEEIIKAIKETDNQVQDGLKELYENLPAVAFKRMRRTMPVTHQKFADMYRTKMFS